MTLRTPGPKLLGPNGTPISSEDFRPQNKKASQPITGNAFGDWAGRDVTFATLPGGGVVQFDLSKLRVTDFRNMRDHYQVNASLLVLNFMQHQSNFTIDCSDSKIADFCDENMHLNWTMLNRAMGTANWAGYSPNVLEYDNDLQSRSTPLTKIKDLVPEECRVNWKKVEGWAPPGRVKPKFREFDGIHQIPGHGWPIPVDNSFWYPILMQNGDYYGTKLLRPAFQSWFFSMLVHLFANRYYERFGEPVPVGRAPFDDTIEQLDGTQIRGNAWMLKVLQDLRNRSVVVLPNDHDVDGNGRPMYDYDIEYLESQMRGADFERYMTRLDEEVSIALFTPILLLRTADVGSYNLGQGHMQLYLWMLNAMNDDRAYYIDRYILNRLVDYNFSPNAPRAHIKFEKLDNKNSDLKKEVLLYLIRYGGAGVDLNELGQAVGMTLHQIQQTDPTHDPNAAPPGGTGGGGTGGTKETTPPAKSTPAKNRETITVTQMRATHAIIREITARVQAQTVRAFKDNRFGAGLQVSMGFRNRLSKAFDTDGVGNPETSAVMIFNKMDNWLSDVVAIGQEGFAGPEQFMELFTQVLGNEVAEYSS